MVPVIMKRCHAWFVHMLHPWPCTRCVDSARGFSHPHLVPCTPPGLAVHNMTVHFETITGRVFSLNVEPADTVETAKLVLVDAWGVDFVLEVSKSSGLGRAAAAHQVRLIFAGKQLEDGRTLADYNIQQGAKMHAVLRMPCVNTHDEGGLQDGTEENSWCAG